MGIKYRKTDEEAGFALLMTLIVVGVVVSVGMAILDLSIKQVRLSTNARESEVAFHAANAGMECARYWRRASATEMERGLAISPFCFGVAASPNSRAAVPAGDLIRVDPSHGEVFQYDFSFSWGGSDPRCTQVTALVASSSVLGDGVTTTNMTTYIPGYPDGNDKYCEPGARCSVISVRGYNRPCSTVGGFGTVQREVLLQF